MRSTDAGSTERSLTCARYTSSRQKFEGGCTAEPVMVDVLDVVVFLKQAIVVIVINIVILRVDRSTLMSH
jgi:hypothetical protein